MANHMARSLPREDYVKVTHYHPFSLFCVQRSWPIALRTPKGMVDCPESESQRPHQVSLTYCSQMTAFFLLSGEGRSGSGESNS